MSELNIPSEATMLGVMNELSRKVKIALDYFAMRYGEDARGRGCGTVGVESVDELENIPGFPLLGTGHFSAVYETAGMPGLVIKVGIKQEDSGAMYAAWCRDNQHLAHIPRIIMLRNIDQFYMVVMPKYNEYVGEWQDKLGIRMRALLQWDEDDEQRGSSYYDHYTKQSLAYHLGGSLYTTITAIREFFQGIASFDLHSSNYMVDQDGQIVITDPVSFKRKEEPRASINDKPRLSQCFGFPRFNPEIKAPEQFMVQQAVRDMVVLPNLEKDMQCMKI